MPKALGASAARSTRCIALWGPFLLFAALVLLDVLTPSPIVPGGQPIGALERGVAKASSRRCRQPPARPPPCRAGGRGEPGGRDVSLPRLRSRRRTVATYMARHVPGAHLRASSTGGRSLELLMALNLLERVGAHPRPSRATPTAQVWRFVPSCARPAARSRSSCPISVLLGTLLTFLHHEPEQRGRSRSRPRGMSAHQVLAPLLVASLGVACRVVRVQRPRRQPRLRGARPSWQTAEYRAGPARPWRPHQRLGARRRRQLIQVDSAHAAAATRPG